MNAVAVKSVIWLPVFGVAAFGLYLVAATNAPQQLYLSSIRNIYFDCMEFSSDVYVFKMKPGTCRLSNLEYDTTLTHDTDGFRNERRTADYRVVTIGSSATHGFGVGDDQTFASLLDTQYGYPTRNLGMGAYATLRELEVLRRYGNGATYVVLQYSQYDRVENAASLRLTGDEFRAQVETRWKNAIAAYRHGKRLGYRKPLYDLVVMLATGAYTTKSAWRRSAADRELDTEAAALAQILERYRDVLEGKRVIIFELSDSGRNSPRFVEVFGPRLKGITWLAYRMVDITRVLDVGDYYFLDDHPRPIGHRKVAAAIAAVITRWQNLEPEVRTADTETAHSGDRPRARRTAARPGHRPPAAGSATSDISPTTP